MNDLKPCPFCGLALDASDGDTVYPTGAGWKDEGEHRSYHNMHAVPDEQWCWGVHCQCGAGVSGDSRAEAVGAWNARAIPSTHRVVSVELLERLTDHQHQCFCNGHEKCQLCRDFAAIQDLINKET